MRGQVLHVTRLSMRPDTPSLLPRLSRQLDAAPSLQALLPRTCMPLGDSYWCAELLQRLALPSHAHLGQ